MSDELFEGAIINEGRPNEKRFPFVRVTVAKQAKFIKMFRATLFYTVMQILFPSSGNLRMWKKTRSIAFVKTGAWKWFRVVPKELRCANMQLKLAGELQASFFGYVAAEVKGHDTPLEILKGLQTENNKAKSAG